MATLTIEIKKYKGQKEHPVSFLVCQGKRKKRLPTGIKVKDSELSSNGKKIKAPEKAMLIEKKRRELKDRLDSLMMSTVGQNIDLDDIVRHLTAGSKDIDFFSFAEDWVNHSGIKGAKNYFTMLNTMEKFIGDRKLPFSAITYDFLKRFEEYLGDRPRAKTLYLGQMRHLYREAMRRYNTDYEDVIKGDPFMRYKGPRQVLKKGVRALTLEQLLSIYRYEGEGRSQLARDCFILSFCLMGMNSVDMYNASTFKNGYICYNRTKTKDRRSDDAYIEVKVQPFIETLARKYRGKKRVFRFYEMYSSDKDFNRALNIGLKTIGETIGVEGLSFYQARHTFATLSRNLMRFSKSDVDEALNHVGGMELADVYIAKDFSIINDNNAKLLEKVFKEGTTALTGSDPKE